MIDKRLTVLRTLAETGTVTATAHSLHYTPSAVSHQLKTLSEDIGTPVVEQHGRGMRLTPAGRVLLRHTHELLARWEEMRGDVLATAETYHGGVLRMAGFSTAAGSLLPAAAESVRESFPNGRVHIIEADPEECFELLLTDQVDVAVVVATDSLPPRSDARFTQRDLLTDPLDLLVHETHPLAGRKEVALSEAADEEWILDRDGSPYHRLVMVACTNAGFRPEVTHQSHEWETGAALVGARLGVALVPRLAKLPSGHAVVRVPLRGDPVPSRRILTGVRRGSDHHPIIAAALESLDEAARNLEQSLMAP